MYKSLLIAVAIALFASSASAENKKNKLPLLPTFPHALSNLDFEINRIDSHIKALNKMEADSYKKATTLANTSIEWSIRNENIDRVQLLNASTTNVVFQKEIQDPNNKDKKLTTGIGIHQFFTKIMEDKSNTWICISGSLEIQVIPQWIKTDALTQHPEVVREHITFSDHCLLINGPTEQVISQKIVVGANTEKEFAVKLRAINPSLGTD